MQRRSSLQSTYENTLERLGATQEQNPGYRAKVAFGDSLGHLAKAMQEYYADGNNALVDGLFTAAEIKLLVTPTSLRPAQYRPDLPMLVEQWRANFWNPEWEIARAKVAALPSSQGVLAELARILANSGRCWQGNKQNSGVLCFYAAAAVVDGR